MSELLHWIKYKNIKPLSFFRNIFCISVHFRVFKCIHCIKCTTLYCNYFNNILQYFVKIHGSNVDTERTDTSLPI